jgi:hypothetical protein
MNKLDECYALTIWAVDRPTTNVPAHVTDLEVTTPAARTFLNLDTIAI